MACYHSKEDNPTRRYNNYKSVCTKHESTQIYKTIKNKRKGTHDNNIIIVQDFNTHLSMDRSSKQKIDKETVALNDTVDHMDLTETFKTFYPKRPEYTLFSITHGIFSRIDHIFDHKTGINK